MFDLSSRSAYFDAGVGLGAMAGLLALWQLSSLETEGEEKEKHGGNSVSGMAV